MFWAQIVIKIRTENIRYVIIGVLRRWNLRILGLWLADGLFRLWSLTVAYINHGKLPAPRRCYIYPRSDTRSTVRKNTLHSNMAIYKILFTLLLGSCSVYGMHDICEFLINSKLSCIHVYTSLNYWIILNSFNLRI